MDTRGEALTTQSSKEQVFDETEPELVRETLVSSHHLGAACKCKNLVCLYISPFFCFSSGSLNVQTCQVDQKNENMLNSHSQYEQSV